VFCMGPAAFNSKLNVGSCALLAHFTRAVQGARNLSRVVPPYSLPRFQLQSHYAKLKQILKLPLPLHHTNKLASQSCSRKMSIGPF